MVRSAVRRGAPLPGNPASAVYGTILVAGQLAVESSAGSSIATAIASLATTLAVFWLAHAYTDTLGSALQPDLVEAPSLRHALRTEWPIVESGLFPAAGLLAATVFGVSRDRAITIALVIVLAELLGWGLLVARRSGRHGWRLMAYAAVVGALGIVLVGLKYAIH